MTDYSKLYSHTSRGFHPRMLKDEITGWLLSLNPGIFKYDGRVYKRFSHPYNTTYANSRSCEIPILMRAIKQYDPNKVLEVGNVLRHYYPVKHEVVDLYDPGSDYMADIATWQSNNKKYDLIISCSTMEHIGRDETDRTPGKCTRALHNVISMLAPGGQLIMTWGLNDNPELEKAVDKLPTTRRYIVGHDGIRGFKSWHEIGPGGLDRWEKVLCIVYYHS